MTVVFIYRLNATGGTGKGHANIVGINEAENFAIVQRVEGREEVTTNTVDL